MKALREPDRIALAKLLADEDPRTLQLLQSTLAERGAEGITFLESVVRDGSPSAQRNAMQMLRVLRETAAWEALAKFCATCGGHFDLEAATWLVARTRYPEFDEAAYRARINQMAQELRERLTGRETPRATIEVCNHYLFRTLGFRGNRQDYWHPAPYWWPNPDSPDGMPYIHRDGERRPGTALYEPGSEEFDRSNLQRMIEGATVSALAWRTTGEQRYAETDECRTARRFGIVENHRLL